MRNFDIDFESRDLVAAIHPNPYVIPLHDDVLGNSRQDILAQNGEKIRLTSRRAFVGQ